MASTNPFLTLVSTIQTNSIGSTIATGYIPYVSTAGRQAYSNTLSTLTVSTLTATAMTCSTLVGSTLTGVSTITSNVNCSTLVGSTLNAVSTVTGNVNCSTISANTVSAATLNTTTINATTSITSANIYPTNVFMGNTSLPSFSIGNLYIQRTTNIQTNLTINGSSGNYTDLYLPITSQIAMYSIFAITTMANKNDQWYCVSYATFWNPSYATGGVYTTVASNTLSIAVENTTGRIIVNAGGSGSYSNSIVVFNRML